jgi:hypothetical protein
MPLIYRVFQNWHASCSIKNNKPEGVQQHHSGWHGKNLPAQRRRIQSTAIKEIHMRIKTGIKAGEHGKPIRPNVVHGN